MRSAVDDLVLLVLTGECVWVISIKFVPINSVVRKGELAVDVAGEIRAARNWGDVHCGLSARPTPSVSELAAEFGLADDPAFYKEIDVDTARWLAAMVINQDMAYNAEIVPAARAADLAERFIAQFGTEEVRYYTNGTFHENQGPKLGSPSATWDPVTGATFDTGILAIGRQYSGCLWVEDED